MPASIGGDTDISAGWAGGCPQAPHDVHRETL
ncbi:acetoacetate--CoA ligase family protein [Mycolicibacterium fortuitum]|nr:acetoacetate--CoA ligase family protein [Mycolicibacterium fortuitum]